MPTCRTLKTRACAPEGSGAQHCNFPLCDITHVQDKHTSNVKTTDIHGLWTARAESVADLTIGAWTIERAAGASLHPGALDGFAQAPSLGVLVLVP